MTEVEVEWVTMSTPEFVGWTRLSDVELPFPLNTNEQAYVECPDASGMRALLAARRLEQSPVLDAARRVFADPRLVVFAVRSGRDGVEHKYVGLAGRDDSAVLVLLDPDSTSVREIADTDLAAGVVGGLPPIPYLPFAPVEVPSAALAELDRILRSGQTSRSIQAQLSGLHLPPEVIAFQQSVTAQPPAGLGLVGAVGYDAAAPQGRPSTRGGMWQESGEAALLQISRRQRTTDELVVVAPVTADALFQAAVEAIASCYEQAAQ